MNDSNITVSNIVLADEIGTDEQTLLTYRIEYPEFSSENHRNCMTRINRYFRSRAADLQREIEGNLFRSAMEQYEYTQRNGFPFRIYDVIETYEVTYIGECAISVVSDRYIYTGGAHGSTVRTAMNVSLANCTPLALGQLISCPPDTREFIMEEVEREILKQPDIYFENYAELIRRNFNRNNFYLTDEGIIVFYQQYDIAPYSSGIREFLIPYNECVKNPEILCL